MDKIMGILGACNVVKKAEKTTDEDDASDVQLNAFEFRNYRTSLDDPQQKLLERIVNQTASSLVKGKTLKVNNFEEKVYMDKDLLVLWYNGDWYPLRTVTKMDFFKDTDDMMGAPWVVEVTFEGRDVERGLIFNFEQERQRLNFALTLRVLRTRDPALDVNQPMEVVFQEDEEDVEIEHKTFNRIVSTQHYNIEDAGIPIIFSVSDLKLYQKLQSTSRHVYLEFFVRYPDQDRYLYAKSPTTHIPPQVMQTEDAHYKRKKEKKEGDDTEQQLFKDKDGKPEALCTMRFDLKNVKMKVPKVPHQIFGRLMAKDDYFPTAVGTFDFKLDKTFLQDRRALEPDEKAKDHGGKDDSQKEPIAIGIPMWSAMKVAGKPSADKNTKKEEDKIIQIGQLNVRILGYVVDSEKLTAEKAKKQAKKDKKDAGGDSDEESHEESSEEHSEEEKSEKSEEEAEEKGSED